MPPFPSTGHGSLIRTIVCALGLEDLDVCARGLEDRIVCARALEDRIVCARALEDLCPKSAAKGGKLNLNLFYHRVIHEKMLGKVTHFLSKAQKG